MTQDWRFKTRSHWDQPADSRLLLVSIDENSLSSFGGWPWSRKTHADFIRLLAEAKAKVVTFDILFTEPKISSTDLELSQAAELLPSFISGAVRQMDDPSSTPFDPGITPSLKNITGSINQLNGADNALSPLPSLNKTSTFGFVDSDPDGSDGVRRSIPLLIRIGSEVYPSLTLQSALHYFKIKPDEVKITLGKKIELKNSEINLSIPINGKGEMMINYRHPKTFSAIGYASLASQLYQTHVQNVSVMPIDLTDKILMIGQTSVGLTDLGPSPLGSMTPLVMVHMNALNNLLKKDFLIPVSYNLVMLSALLITLLSLFYLRDKDVTINIILPVILLIGYLIICFVLFAFKSILLPMAEPVIVFFIVMLGDILLRWQEELSSKKMIKQIFGTYVSPQVMDKLLKSPDNIKLGGIRQPVSILFSDIRDFTSISEKTNEEALVEQLNEYFEKMVDCVNIYHGTLHKYIGDAVMAVWGDVLSEGTNIDVQNSVRSALKMRQELVKLNEYWKQRGKQEIRIGLGINHGEVIVGNIGASQRREFTVIGDAVNLASRLEGITKDYHTDLVIGESARQFLGETFAVRSIGLIQVKGKQKPVRAFEVWNDQATKEELAWIEKYEKAFNLMIQRQFAEAEKLFHECLSSRSTDFCANLYAEDCSRFQKEAPSPEWNGVKIMKNK
jgi:adenylate cyclase